MQACSISNKFIAIFAALAALIVSVAVRADHGVYVYDVAPGSDVLDTQRLQPYRANWQQLKRVEDGLLDSGTVFEELLEISPERLRHTQIVRTESGPVVTETRDFDLTSLLPTRLYRTLENGPPDQPKEVELKRDNLLWSGPIMIGEKTATTFEYATEVAAFDGWVAGLTLAALPLKEGYAARLPTMVQFQRATYWLHAEVAGRKDYPVTADVTIPVWIVDTEWVNVVDGSVSEGGEYESGGSYLIAVAPQPGQPHVVEYANKGAVIRWVP